MANFIVTIDGPAGSGKSTIARQLADRLGAAFLDTGAMYRAVTLAAMHAGVEMSDASRLSTVLESGTFCFSIAGGKMQVSLDGMDITEQIRRPEVTANARYIAAAPALREKLVQMQREFAQAQGSIVTEGRDQGTVAFPDANVKFYLTADPAERAKRRQRDLLAQGTPQNVEQIQKDLEQRDKSDAGRAVGPMKPAHDAVIVDTTHLNVEQVVDLLLKHITKTCSKTN